MILDGSLVYVLLRFGGRNGVLVADFHGLFRAFWSVVVRWVKGLISWVCLVAK